MATVPRSDSPMKLDDSRYENVVSPSAKDEMMAMKTGDAALAVLGGGNNRRKVTIQEDRAVRRKIDLWVMPVVLLVYFLQQLDKSSLSYTSVFGIVQETGQSNSHLDIPIHTYAVLGLVGSQYSWLSSIVYVAQLIWQPISSYLLVKLPVAKYLFVHVLMWGVIVASSAAAKNFAGLITARFFLGIFEATVAPAFITITQMWWRRREQTMRLSMWMAMNGGTGMIGSLLSYGLGHIHGRLHPYQTIFLFIGLLTIACSPVVLFVLPDSPIKAKFLTHDEKVVALERLRANNQGTESKIWKWDQVWDLFLDPKTYLWFLLLFVCAVPSGGIGAFGPLIIQGFGFDQFKTILFNIPFNGFQVIVTLAAAYISTRLKLKWPVVFVLTLPPIAGASALLVLGRGMDMKNKLLGCYYVLSFFTALQPMLYTWSAQNTAGHTKKTCTTGVVFIAQCAGNIVGPLLYTTEEKPYYRRGLIANLICWISLAVLTLITACFLSFRNRQHARRRLELGKNAVIIDTSLEEHMGPSASDDGMENVAENDQAFFDLTDTQNEDFIFVL
ncbi:major facilitator superfamily domain-containing protein [Crucibulum laeve]|uniref:Major facilitator superfamily domain-containing protein n=1 Tax=Crucibulum laeve TaxID=68775 RepID=A0A5C3M690_9AGAR|nr:major facilitator superfamily domain-containing protein [Crucibulum laeve]